MCYYQYQGTIGEPSTEQTSWADLTEQAEEEEREHQRRIAQLKIKRANLKFKEEKNRRFELWRQSLLDHEIAQRFVELEIRPLFLVLDTNCYIDYLPNIRLLINHRKFIVVVPLIGEWIRCLCRYIVGSYWRLGPGIFIG